MSPFVFWSLAAVNVLTFVVFGVDKWRAKRRDYRVPEATLLLLTACTGVVGAWAGRATFKHKTRKKSFQWKFHVATLCNLFWIWLWARSTR